MKQPLLSVIVTCYNLEQFVDKCVSSIVGQTYSSLEILLIDDGSADSTGIKCDEWLEKDQRIRVIHKQNEGLAYARKTGIENAMAEYVTFVDVDDWIDRNMYADMMSALMSTNSDIAQCSVCIVFEDGRMEYRESKHKKGDFEIFGRVEGSLLILEDQKWRPWMWNKIFKKDLFESIEFPKGRSYGEDYISLFLFHKASQSVYLHNVYYYYYQRNNSITNPGNIAGHLRNLSEFSDTYFDRYFFVKQHPEYYSEMPYVKYMTLCVGLNLLRNIIEHKKYFTDNYFSTKSSQLRSISLDREDKLQRGLKVDLFLLKIGTKWYKLVRKSYAWIISVTNKLKLTNKRTSWLLDDCFWIN